MQNIKELSIVLEMKGLEGGNMYGSYDFTHFV